MSKFLLRNVWFALTFFSCAPSAHNSISQENKNKSIKSNQPASGLIDIDSTNILQYDFLANKTPLSLMDLPQTEEGGVVLSNGYYQADFKSYCLQPGTPSPSSRDAYLQAPLSGYRKDIIETVLRNSLAKRDLEQKNIQLLLWSVVSGSNFNNLSPAVKSTAYQLLTPKQVFELKGGVMGIVKTVSAALPSSHNDLQKLFEMGNGSYEMYERIAVLRQPSEISHPDYKKDQWYKQADGYYVRYFPESYQHVRIQVYVPDGMVTPTGKYMIFDPVSLLAVPANSNAQRLGIGAPVLDVVRAIIHIQKGSGNVKKLPDNKNPKTGTLN